MFSGFHGRGCSDEGLWGSYMRQKAWSGILMHMLYTGWVNLVQVYAEVIVRRKCVIQEGWTDCGPSEIHKGSGAVWTQRPAFYVTVMNSNILLPTSSLCNYFIFSGHRIPELANSLTPVFCQAIPVRIQTALTCHLNNRHINFSQPQHNITHTKSLGLRPWIYDVVTQWVTEIYSLLF